MGSARQNFVRQSFHFGKLLIVCRAVCTKQRRGRNIPSDNTIDFFGFDTTATTHLTYDIVISIISYDNADLFFRDAALTFFLSLRPLLHDHVYGHHGEEYRLTTFFGFQKIRFIAFNDSVKLAISKRTKCIENFVSPVKCG